MLTTPNRLGIIRLRILLVAVSGWVNRHQLDIIDYVREENLWSARIPSGPESGPICRLFLYSRWRPVRKLGRGRIPLESGYSDAIAGGERLEKSAESDRARSPLWRAELSSRTFWNFAREFSSFRRQGAATGEQRLSRTRFCPSTRATARSRQSPPDARTRGSRWSEGVSCRSSCGRVD